MDVRCTQCSAAVTVPPDARLVRCSFCEAALVIDASGILFNEMMLPTLHADQVPAIVRRFLASDRTVSGLEREATIGEPALEYFPFWAFTTETKDGEKTILEPAAPSALMGLQGLTVPAGETVPMSSKVTGETRVVEPEVPLSTAQGWLKDRHGEARLTRSVLYHLPLYRITYTYRGRTYLSAVDAVSGRLFPSAYPVKAETPYRVVLVLAIVVFGLEGCVVSDPAMKAVIYMVSAPPILAAAWWVIRRS